MLYRIYEIAETEVAALEPASRAQQLLDIDAPSGA